MADTPTIEVLDERVRSLTRLLERLEEKVDGVAEDVAELRGQTQVRPAAPAPASSPEPASSGGLTGDLLARAPGLFQRIIIVLVALAAFVPLAVSVVDAIAGGGK